MAKKSYIIIGVGTFGTSVVKTLAHTNVEVMVIDNDPRKLEAIASIVTDSICANADDPEVLKSLGVSNYDGALVTLGRNLESRVLITMMLKDLGVPFVMAKAMSDIEARLLTKVGADRLVFPEREMGIHIGNQIARGNLMSSVELTENYSIVDLAIPESWNRKTIKELNIRAKYGISIIGIRTEKELKVNPSPDDVLDDREVLVILGENSRIDALREKVAKER